MQFDEKSRSVYTRLKALKEIFSLMAFIRVLIVVNVVETSPFGSLMFDAFDFRLLILLSIYGVYCFVALFLLLGPLLPSPSLSHSLPVCGVSSAILFSHYSLGTPWSLPLYLGIPPRKSSLREYQVTVKHPECGSNAMFFEIIFHEDFHVTLNILSPSR